MPPKPARGPPEETEFLQLVANVLSVAVATKVASDDRRVLMCRLVRAQEEVVGMGARAEMSGGRLRVRSVPGHGTIIEFWIPIPGSGEPSAVTAVTDTIPAPA
jgi:hypothetical protein